MERTRLTNQRVERAKCPSDKKQAFLWDSETPRLAVRTTAAGAKAFIFEGKLDRRTIRLTIGKPSNWTIDSARKEARRLQSLIDQGIDPRDVKREQQVAREKAERQAEKDKDTTLKALLDLYSDHCLAQGKRRFAAAVRSATKCHLVEADPYLAKMAAKKITPEQVAGLVRRVMEAGKGRTAGAFRSYLAAAFNCARKAPVSAELPAAFIDFDIKSNPVDPVPAIPVNARQRTLSKDELKAYLKGLDGADRIDMALRLAVYAGGQRMSQLLRARTEDYDTEAKTLTLWDPKGNRKTPRKHIVPLGTVGASILADLVKMAEAEESALLFPSKAGTPIHVSNPGKRVSEISTDMDGEVFNLLDIRRTIETMLAGLGVGRDIRAQLLSHGISGVQAVHYDQHDYLKEKRATIRKWEAFLRRLMEGKGRKVISLNEAKQGRAL